jgi:hypothetical protein
MNVLNHNFIRLGLTRAKALQTANRFLRETRRRFAVPKSNAFTLKIQVLSLAISPMLWHEKLLFEPAIMICEISVLQG